MQFLHAGFLWALAAIAIPVIIHLFNFRRYKTIYFSNVAFLKDIKEETASRSKLKHLLVLASRILALAFLVFAFAQPFIPKKNTDVSAGKKYVSVYVDNSFSMKGMSGGMSLLDKAKLAAKEVVKNYATDDLFQLLTNDFQGKQQRLVSKEEFLTMLEEVEVSAATRNLAEVTKRQKDALGRDNAKNQVAYLLTDFQKSAGVFVPDSLVKYNLVPLAADVQSNLYIDTCWFNQPIQLLNQSNQLIVRVRNTGEKSIENSRLVLKLNGQTKAIANYSVDAGSQVYDTLSFVMNKAGWNQAELSLEDYPITYDDAYFIAFNVVNQVKVFAVNESASNSYLDALFKNQSEFNYNSSLIGALNYSQLSGNQLVVLANLKTIPSGLSSVLASYLEQGGAVLVFLADKCDQDGYNKFFTSVQANTISGFAEQEQEMAKINLQQNVFKDVFERVPENLNLPKTKKYYTFSSTTTSNAESILTLKNGNSLVSYFPYKAGALYVSAVPLDKNFSELPVHSVFAPMLYKMAILGAKSSAIAYFLGDKTQIEISSKASKGEQVYQVKGQRTEFIPEQYSIGNKVLLGIKDQVKEAGFYKVGLEKSDSTDIVALNYNRKESELSFYNTDFLKQQFATSNVNILQNSGAEITQLIKELDRGTSLWKACLLLALLFLAIEILLLRFWKV